MKSFKCPDCKGYTLGFMKTYGKVFGVCTSCHYTKEYSAEDLQNMIKRHCDMKNCNNVIEDGGQKPVNIVVGDVSFDCEDTCPECVKGIQEALTKIFNEGIPKAGKIDKKPVTRRKRTVTHTTQPHGSGQVTVSGGGGPFMSNPSSVDDIEITTPQERLVEIEKERTGN